MTPRRPRPSRALAAGATSLVLALAVTACGGDSEGTANPPAGTTTSPASDALASAPPATASESTAPAEGGSSAKAAAKDWVTALDELVDSSVPAKLRAAHIKGGADLVSAIPQLDRAVAGIPLKFSVTAPVLDGNDGEGVVGLTSKGEDFGSVRGVTFAQVDGTWRLTRAGVCQMAAVAGLTCP